MKYILLDNNVVVEILPEFSPIFPGVPITDRYPADFLSQCVTVEDDVEVNEHDEYVNGVIKPPITVEFNTETEGLITYEVNTEGLPIITADDTVVVTEANTGYIYYSTESYGSIHFRFIAADSREYNQDLLVGEIPEEPEPITPEKESELEQRVADLEAENESISEVLDALLMGDIEV